jgi:hypothetical protein
LENFNNITGPNARHFYHKNRKAGSFLKKGAILERVKLSFGSHFVVNFICGFSFIIQELNPSL